MLNRRMAKNGEHKNKNGCRIEEWKWMLNRRMKLDAEQNNENGC